MCGKHYQRWRKYGDPTAGYDKNIGTPEERFWQKVDRSDDGCWTWLGCMNTDGYGQIRVGKMVKAHRFAYELMVGSIPAGFEIDHRCRNRACVRPDHLRLASKKENSENLSRESSHNDSGVRGVTLFKPTQRWKASVRHHGELFYLGLFDTIAEADAVVTAKRLELFSFNDADRA